MGNVQCGDLCHAGEDKKEIVQIQVTPGDPSEWNKENEKTSLPMNNQFKLQSSAVGQLYESNVMASSTNQKKGELISFNDEDKTSVDESGLPPVEVQMQQNHYIVPHSLVLSRVTDKIQLLLKKQFATSPLMEEDARWYLLKSGNYYHGQLKSQQPYGIGTYLLPGKVYYGETRHGKPEGMGVLLGQNYIFKGQFREGAADGEGTIESQNFNAKGMFKLGQIITGKIITRQYVYEGPFSKNQPHGPGFYNNNIEKITYEGEFQNGKFHGEGVYSCPLYNYKGSFQNGMKDGRGDIEFFRGDVKVRKGVWSQDREVKVF